MIPKPVIQAAESAIPVVREALENPAAVFGAFEKSVYDAWQVAPRVMNAPIRTIETAAAEAARLREESAKLVDELFPGLRNQIPKTESRIYSDPAARVASVRFGSERFGAEHLEPALPELLQPWRQTHAGYAQMIYADAEAYKAASTIQRKAIGFVPRMIEAEATREQMQKTALEGALAYMGKGGNANKYTEFLISRFGSV